MALRTPAQKPRGSARMTFLPPDCRLLSSVVAIWKRVRNGGVEHKDPGGADYCHAVTMRRLQSRGADPAAATVHGVGGGLAACGTGGREAVCREACDTYRSGCDLR